MNNWDWSLQWLPQIRQIVGPLLLQQAPLEIDRKQATDLLVLNARDMRIAARVRRNEYFESFWPQFTIRCQLESGTETELSKIVNGWADWFFYGFADEGNNSIPHWFVIDLDAFRAALIRNSAHKIYCGTQPNYDGSYFKWYDLRSFPEKPPLLIAASESMTERL